MRNYNNAFAEVNEILSCLDEEEYNKIPVEFIRVIEENRNKDYTYILDEELELSEQTMLPETKAILFNIYRDYLSSPEQKEKIIKIQREERRRNEERKRQNYSNGNTNYNFVSQTTNIAKEETIISALPTKIKKQSWWQRIINKIQRCFKIV